jgi:hypothetical protein
MKLSRELQNSFTERKLLEVEICGFEQAIICYINYAITKVVML